MLLIVDTTGLGALTMRFQDARAELPGLMQQAAQEAGQVLVDDLSASAPVGANEGPPPPGDGPGRLAESFFVRDESETSVAVCTTQPLKLQYVRYGRGEVLPVRKRALMWPGLDHPVRRAGPSQPNDFLTPVIQDFNLEEALQPVVDKLAVIIEG